MAAGVETELSLSLLGQHDDVAGVAFPYFGGNENPHFRSVRQEPVLVRQLPVKRPLWRTVASGWSSAFTIWCWLIMGWIVVWMTAIAPIIITT